MNTTECQHNLLQFIYSFFLSHAWLLVLLLWLLSSHISVALTVLLFTFPPGDKFFQLFHTFYILYRCSLPHYMNIWYLPFLYICIHISLIKSVTLGSSRQSYLFLERSESFFHLSSFHLGWRNIRGRNKTNYCAWPYFFGWWQYGVSTAWFFSPRSKTLISIISSIMFELFPLNYMVTKFID
jgi:hypothetical protein